jgi:ABC-type amino acid transport system permease subunit
VIGDPLALGRVQVTSMFPVDESIDVVTVVIYAGAYAANIVRSGVENEPYPHLL